MMTNEENYCFDAGGYLIVPGVLSDTMVAQLNEAFDATGQFIADGTATHPVVVGERREQILIAQLLCIEVFYFH